MKEKECSLYNERMRDSQLMTQKSENYICENIIHISCKIKKNMSKDTILQQMMMSYGQKSHRLSAQSKLCRAEGGRDFCGVKTLSAFPTPQRARVTKEQPHST